MEMARAMGAMGVDEEKKPVCPTKQRVHAKYRGKRNITYHRYIYYMYVGKTCV